MAKEYKPATQSSKNKPIISKSVRDVVRVDSLEPTKETFDQITELASRGYSTRSIAYMLGVTTPMFEEFRDLYQNEVMDSINLGRAIDETECISILRATATNTRASNSNAAMKLYGDLNFGWGGKNSLASGKDLPRSISFTMIEAEQTEDDNNGT